MSGPNKNTNPAEDLMAALLKEVGEVEVDAAELLSDSEETSEADNNEPLELLDLGNGSDKTVIGSNSDFSNSKSDNDFDSKTSFGYDSTQLAQQQTKISKNTTQLTHFEELAKNVAPPQLQKQTVPEAEPEAEPEAAYDISDESLDEDSTPEAVDRTEIMHSRPVEETFASIDVSDYQEDIQPNPTNEFAKENANVNEIANSVDSLFGPPSEELPITYLSHEETVARVAVKKNQLQQTHDVSNETVVLHNTQAIPKTKTTEANDHTVALQKEDSFVQPTSTHESERTLAVTGFKQREVENYDDKVKVAIGHNRPAYSSGYASWGGGSDVSLGHSENLRIAQEKILDLEKENEKLRIQNEELLSASEIIKERSDLLTAQVSEYKNDRDGLEESFKNEIALLKGHLHRKDVENQKAQIKIDDLDSRLKFDMKKIRIRERELENRLELVRAEKNALMKSKDEQILDLRRKMDVMQMEVDSYRQKCVELNKSLEVNQDSFKRTTRALRLAMANLELQEENKVSFKKVD